MDSNRLRLPVGSGAKILISGPLNDLHIDFLLLFAYSCFCRGILSANSEAICRHVQAMPPRRSVWRRMSFRSGPLRSLALYVESNESICLPKFFSVSKIILLQSRLGLGDIEMFDPDAAIPRPNRSLIYFGACIIAGLRLAREKQVNVRVFLLAMPSMNR